MGPFSLPGSLPTAVTTCYTLSIGTSRYRRREKKMIRISQLARTIATENAISADEALRRILGVARELEIVERILSEKQAAEIKLIVVRELDQPAPERAVIG
ncbi:hypothetical protein QEH44_gp57 [Arthrobacter phage Shambre1]|uniref:Uncharacterized protein n=1 Tax=Arthrobacter phage Shambre1 TaxID=2927284 RepID=A0A977KNM1_9CAUD|nr:hypothetical protein QEH44_gp57 [Arthrobacter phage Shambre1]UXE04793.1 hypothetical protein SEA_SHAMBRE1_57 [Arthrobacter phage Shambre1]